VKISIFGAGYVGLVQAAAFAEMGHEIVCVDLNEARIARLNSGESPIFEPDLEEMIQRNLKAGTLSFTTDSMGAIDHAAVLFIAVGTPSSADGSADLSHVVGVAKTIASHMRTPRIIVMKSTVPVGTNDKVREILASGLKAAGRPEIGFEVVSNPEFLREGSAVADCMRPDRIILGTSSAEAEKTLRDIYAPFNRNHEKIIVMDARSAELTKYAANAMLATRISFMNEMANIADRVGADIEWVRKGIGSDPRIGYSFIYSGIGYGGSCFPKDVQALIHTAEATGFAPQVLTAVQERNAAQKQVMVDKIVSHFGENLSGKVFALWGLAFKPDTDDMREAPSRVIMEALWARGASVQAYDPAAMDECRHLYGERSNLTLVETRDAALAGADALIIATEWKAFRSVDFAELKVALRSPAIFDGRNVLEPTSARAAGFAYFGIGR
jgi:UDPglucose 6-dehydrogenase